MHDYARRMLALGLDVKIGDHPIPQVTQLDTCDVLWHWMLGSKMPKRA